MKPAAAVPGVLLAAFLALGAAKAGEPPGDAGLPEAEARRLGERIYRDGILPSGEPVRAVVQGDIPVDGRMFACASCHLRSGIGATEGSVLTLPTNAARLFAPLRRGVAYDAAREARRPRWFDSGHARPAYTDETLARALRAGVDPAGRRLSETMPRYLLGDRDLAHLVAYLHTLCAEPSPGVDATTITFATVVADDAPAADRSAFLAALRAYVDSHNVQTRQPLRRAAADQAEPMFLAYRLVDLVVWELRGDRGTWDAQLREHLRARPVFALLGGVSGGDWGPVHAFCERERIPCVLPLTDFPVVSATDWYTLYFSKGWYQEGEAAARFLRREGGGAPPLVVVRRPGAAGERFAAGAAAAAPAPPAEVLLPPGAAADAAFWRTLAAGHPGAAFLLALGPDDLAESGALAAAAPGSTAVLAGGMLRGRLGAIPEALRPQARLTWPRRLPGDGDRSALVVAAWAKARGLAPADPDVHARVYLIGWLLTDVFMMMGTDFYRDYFLDVLDMEQDQTYASAVHPRLSFGPGQRYAAKGCYVVGVGPGPDPALTPLSPWVVH